MVRGLGSRGPVNPSSLRSATRTRLGEDEETRWLPGVEEKGRTEEGPGTMGPVCSLRVSVTARLYTA